MSYYDYPELYKFVQGDNSWTYTSADNSYGYADDTYTPASITRGSYEASEELARGNITIEIGLLEDLGQHLIDFQADFITTVSIFKMTPDDTVVIWRGRISSHAVSENKVTITGESIYTSIGRAGLRARFQRNCRYALYMDYGCGLNKDNFEVSTVFSTVSDNVVTVPSAGGYAANYFTGGMIRASNGSYGFIMQHNGTQLILSRRLEQLFVDAAGGQFAIKLYPGCNRTMSDCTNKFNNLDNYGGFPWIPTKNPFGGSSIA